jgi:hypothetical protein
MALRKAGLLETRRDGKFVYYRLSDPAVIDLIRDAALIAGLEVDTFPEVVENGTLEQCVCPHCGEKDTDMGKEKSSLVSSNNI